MLNSKVALKCVIFVYQVDINEKIGSHLCDMIMSYKWYLSQRDIKRLSDFVIKNQTRKKVLSNDNYESRKQRTLQKQLRVLLIQLWNLDNLKEECDRIVKDYYNDAIEKCENE